MIVQRVCMYVRTSEPFVMALFSLAFLCLLLLDLLDSGGIFHVFNPHVDHKPLIVRAS